MQAVIINGTLPVGMSSMPTFYYVIAKNISEYGYMRLHKAFLRGDIGYIGVYRT
jgi:hypothetical protein